MPSESSNRISTLQLIDLIERKIPPEPWVEGEKIPWHEAGFSQRMLMEHLSQEHDAASRRAVIIDRHVEWIHNRVLAGKPAKILELGCGPGLYTSRLAQLGHRCVGIDYGPASIAYARQQAQDQGLDCEYIEADIRLTDYGEGYELVMMVHGELNVFRPAEIRDLLLRGLAGLQPGGHLLAEVHTLATVQATGESGSRWYSSPGGLFSERPHICLQEAYWDARAKVSTERYHIVDAESGSIQRYAASMQGFSEEEYLALFVDCGYREAKIYPAMTGEPAEGESPYIVLVAQKPVEV